MTEENSTNNLHSIPTPAEDTSTLFSENVAVFSALNSMLSHNAFGYYPESKKDENGREVGLIAKPLTTDIGKKGRPVNIQYVYSITGEDKKPLVPYLGEFDRAIYDSLVTIWINFGKDYSFTARQVLQIMTGKEYIPRGNNDELIAFIDDTIEAFASIRLSAEITEQVNKWKTKTASFGDVLSTQTEIKEKDKKETIRYFIKDNIIHIRTIEKQIKTHKKKEAKEEIPQEEIKKERCYCLLSEPLLLTYCKASGNQIVSYPAQSLDITKSDGKPLQLRENNIILTHYIEKRIAIIRRKAEEAYKTEKKEAVACKRKAETDVNKLLKPQDRRILYKPIIDLIENKDANCRKLQDKKEKQRLRETVKDILSSLKTDGIIADFFEYSNTNLHPTKKGQKVRGIEIILTTPNEELSQ